MSLTPQQNIAFRSPCREPEDLSNKRFNTAVLREGRMLSIVLTVDANAECLQFFGGNAVWHCSIAVVDRKTHQPTRIAKLEEVDRKIVMDEIEEVLEGVGDPPRRSISKRRSSPSTIGDPSPNENGTFC